MKNNCFYKIIVTTLFFLANSSYAKIIPPTSKKIKIEIYQTILSLKFLVA